MEKSMETTIMGYIYIYAYSVAHVCTIWVLGPFSIAYINETLAALTYLTRQTPGKAPKSYLHLKSR